MLSFITFIYLASSSFAAIPPHSLNTNVACGYYTDCTIDCSNADNHIACAGNQIDGTDAKSLTVICDSSNYLGESDGYSGCKNTQITCPFNDKVSRCTILCTNPNDNANGTRPGGCENTFITTYINRKTDYLQVTCEGTEACKGLKVYAPSWQQNTPMLGDVSGSEKNEERNKLSGEMIALIVVSVLLVMMCVVSGYLNEDELNVSGSNDNLLQEKINGVFRIKYVGPAPPLEELRKARDTVIDIILNRCRDNDVKKLRRMVDNQSKNGEFSKIRYQFLPDATIQFPNSPAMMTRAAVHALQAVGLLAIQNESFKLKSRGGHPNWSGNVRYIRVSQAWENAMDAAGREELWNFIHNTSGVEWGTLGRNTGDTLNMIALGLLPKSDGHCHQPTFTHSLAQNIANFSL